MMFASLFGAGFRNDAFVVAFMVPNLFRDLFAEGALSSAFIPTFTDYLRRKVRSDAWYLANLVMTALIGVLGCFALLLFFFSRQAVSLAGPGFSSVAGKAELTSALIEIMSPFLMIVALSSVAMGMLNTLGHYFLPALTPALFNVVIISTGLFVAPLLGESGVDPVFTMAAGMVLGALCQFGVQIPLLRREGFRFRPRIDFDHEGLLRMGKLIAPAVIGVSAVQINVLVNTEMATLLEPSDGPVSWLKYAFRIIYLPIGLFGVAVGTVHLRNVSVSASAGDWTGLKETVANSVKLVSLMAIPSSVGLIVLASPIVRVIFERGNFSAQDTHFTSMALAFYAVGLFAYSCQKVFVPTFYALQETRTPVRISLVAVVLNIGFNYILAFQILSRYAADYAYLGLATGTALSVSLQLLFLRRALIRKLGSMSDSGIASSLSRMVLAAVVMAGVLGFCQLGAAAYLPSGPFFVDALALALTISVGAAVYFGACLLLGVDEVKDVFERFRAMLGAQTGKR